MWLILLLATVQILCPASNGETSTIADIFSFADLSISSGSYYAPVVDDSFWPVFVIDQDMADQYWLEPLTAVDSTLSLAMVTNTS